MNSLCKTVKAATAAQQAFGLTPKVNYLRNLAIKQAKEMGLELSWRNNVPRLMKGEKNLILEMYAAGQEYEEVVKIDPGLQDKVSKLMSIIIKAQSQLDKIKELGQAVVREYGKADKDC